MLEKYKNNKNIFSITGDCFIKNKNQYEETYYFSIPLVVTGWLIAVYHNLLHYEIVPESASPCREGVSCANVYIDWFGFITIPFMSFIVFTVLGTILFYLKRKNFYEK